MNKNRWKEFQKRYMTATNGCGWQGHSQTGLLYRGCINDIVRFLRKEGETSVQSRTDAGVHAIWQYLTPPHAFPERFHALSSVFRKISGPASEEVEPSPHGDSEKTWILHPGIVKFWSDRALHNIHFITINWCRYDESLSASTWLDATILVFFLR